MLLLLLAPRNLNLQVSWKFLLASCSLTHLPPTQGHGSDELELESRAKPLMPKAPPKADRPVRRRTDKGKKNDPGAEAKAKAKSKAKAKKTSS